MYNSRKKKVCTKPGILSKLMACFAFNSEHDKIILKDEESKNKLFVCNLLNFGNRIDDTSSYFE